jgi:hypothetical protein
MLREYLETIVGFPGSWLDDWYNALDYTPNNLTIITVDGQSGLANNETARKKHQAVSPTDILRLESIINSYIDKWKKGSSRIVLYFDSLSSFLQDNDIQTSVEFIDRVKTHVICRNSPLSFI